MGIYFILSICVLKLSSTVEEDEDGKLCSSNSLDSDLVIVAEVVENKPSDSATISFVIESIKGWSIFLGLGKSTINYFFMFFNLVDFTITLSPKATPSFMLCVTKSIVL